jgi:hypothetical protein
MGVAAEFSVRIEPSIKNIGGFRASFRPNGGPGVVAECASQQAASEFVLHILDDLQKKFRELARSRTVRGGLQ